MTDYIVENWLQANAEKRIAYSAYWNDEDREKNKEWYILDGNFSKMEKYLQQSGLAEDISTCAEVLQKKYGRKLCGTGLDLAAGNLWAIPHLLRLGAIEKIYCLEYSRHRLLKIGPKVLEHYAVPVNKVVLVYGSFYELHLKDECIDFVFLSSAFHHADDPVKLLSEILRVLKPGGIALVMGEHVVSYPKAYIKYMVKYVASRILPKRAYQHISRTPGRPTRLLPRPNDLFVPDPVLGDHEYATSDYFRMFAEFTSVEHIKRRGSQLQSFVLIK